VFRGITYGDFDRPTRNLLASCSQTGSNARSELRRAVRVPRRQVLRGEHSPALSQQTAERMVAGKQNAALEVIPGADHFIPIETPALFEAAVRRWLGV
jgi:pimeloyl-ACP methyl ester carboxylesterase